MRYYKKTKNNEVLNYLLTEYNLLDWNAKIHNFTQQYNININNKCVYIYIRVYV